MVRVDADRGDIGPVRAQRPYRAAHRPAGTDRTHHAVDIAEDACELLGHDGVGRRVVRVGVLLRAEAVGAFGTDLRHLAQPCLLVPADRQRLFADHHFGAQVGQPAAQVRVDHRVADQDETPAHQRGLHGEREPEGTGGGLHDDGVRAEVAAVAQDVPCRHELHQREHRTVQATAEPHDPRQQLCLGDVRKRAWRHGI